MMIWLARYYGSSKVETVRLGGTFTVVQAPKKGPTLEAFLALPETKPASEYTNGSISQKPMPQGKHSALQQDLANIINTSVRSKKIARAFPELRCSFAPNSVVPDIAVLLWEHIPRDDNGEIANIVSLAPDWTIEILSPGQSSAKVIKKILSCLRHGAQMGWLINPKDKSVFVYCPQQEIEVLDEPENVLPMPAFMSELTLTVKDLFELLLE